MVGVGEGMWSDVVKLGECSEISEKREKPIQ